MFMGACQVMEFGGGPPPEYAMECLPLSGESHGGSSSSSSSSWRDPNAYLAARGLQGAVVRRASNVSECAYSAGWPGSFIMDPLDPA